ncbi:sensor domain-containing diguanylate cyclase [Bacillus sp. PS06]|uniref:sensor domain-containing diguanylate cyclase n=1 Tax=Bacillus sp. PS06 TaxID=2764176 RepID=UPI00177E7AE0|nr:sensor domain-containing diguanylate cyclase [Bacillus sp. PS06]MBD8067861.1 GGDEF domain-containing protein [Bacillus sp. PS06]
MLQIKSLKTNYEQLEKTHIELMNHLDIAIEYEEKYRRILNNISDVILIFELKNGEPSNIIYVNNMAYVKLGYSAEALRSKTPLQLISEQKHTEFTNSLEHILKDEENNKLETIFITKNGEEIPFELHSTLYKEKGKNLVLTVARDITERKNYEVKLTEMAYYDKLTGLANRKMLEVLFKKSLKSVQRSKGQLAVFFIDLDGFKKVNDTLGHDAGDLLLKDVAARLTHTLKGDDIISRLGGDEFIIVTEGYSLEEATQIAERIIEEISKVYMIKNQEARVTPSIGISIYPQHGKDQKSLLQTADKAMYFAKRKGKNTYKIYTEEMANITIQKSGILAKMLNFFQGE